MPTPRGGGGGEALRARAGELGNNVPQFGALLRSRATRVVQEIGHREVPSHLRVRETSDELPRLLREESSFLVRAVC